MLRLQTVPIFVSDQEQALTFYRDILGFKVMMDFQMSPDFRWLVVKSEDGGTELILYCADQAVDEESRADIEQRVGQWTGMLFITDDIYKTHADLVEKGVTFEWEPKMQPWGVYETIFSDFDGNRLHLVQRPANLPFGQTMNFEATVPS